MDRRRFLAAGLAAAATPLLVSVDPARGAARTKVPAPTESLVTRWDTDRWSLGSYSALPPGTSPSVRRTLADTIIGGRIALAGEYASTQFPATVTGAYLSGKYAARRMLDRVSPRTAIVVGAGMAGAASARALADAGVDVQVVEARTRVGGRIHSSSAWGTPVELGAAWIHAVTGNPLVPLAKEAGLRLVPTNYDDAVARDTVTGRPSAAADARWRKIDQLLGRLEDAWPPVDTSVASWLRRAGWKAGRIDDWAQEVEIVQEYGLDTNRLGVRATEEGANYRGGDAMVSGGYDMIVERQLDGVLRSMQSPVERVQSSGSRVTVMLRSGDTLTADAVIVAVPLPILREGTLVVAGMPRSVASALRQIATGNLEKVVLRYDEQWWGDHQVYGIVGGGVPGAPAGSMAALRWTEFYSLTPVLGFPALVGFSGGRAARTRPTGDAGCVREATGALRAAFAG